MKTALEWLKLIADDDTRKRALTNHEIYNIVSGRSEINIKFDTIQRALWSAFEFAETPEGGEYWSNLANSPYLKLMKEPKKEKRYIKFSI